METSNELDAAAEEFKQEAFELLELAESNLLALDQKGDFLANYNSLFRVFHSLKGAAAMFNFESLKSLMHALENDLQQYKDKNELPQEKIDFFLSGVDKGRKFLKGELTVDTLEASKPEQVVAAEPAASVQTPVEPITTKPEPLDLSASKATILSNKFKAFVIDDEPEITSILNSLLTDHDFIIFPFNNPKEALEKIQVENPDLILTDISMPELTGLDVLKQIHKINPDIPVIFVSGNVTKDYLLEAIQHGIYSVVEKPFNENSLVPMCINAVEQFRIKKMLNASINLIMYQFADIDRALMQKKNSDISNAFRQEVQNLLMGRLELRALNRQKRTA